MGEGFEVIPPAARKLLIQKQQQNRVAERKVLSELHGKGGYVPIRLSRWEDTQCQRERRF